MIMINYHPPRTIPSSFQMGVILTTFTFTIEKLRINFIFPRDRRDEIFEERRQRQVLPETKTSETP